MNKIFSKMKNKIDSKMFYTISVILLILLGLIFRIIWITKIPNEPISDYKTYYDIAVSIVNGDLHPLAGYQGIGYPLILAGIFKVFGTTDILIAKIFNVIISTITLYFIFLVSKKLLKNNLSAILVLFILAILPNYIAYNNVIGTETLFLFVFSAILLVYLTDLNNVVKLPLLGILIGVAALIKPQFMVYPLLLALVYILQTKNIKETVIKFSLVTLFMILTISPMTIFNYIKHEEFIPVSYNGGYVLYINNNSQNINGMYMDVTAVEPTQEVTDKLNALQIGYGDLNSKASSIYQEAAIKWIVQNPVDFVKIGLLRVKATFFSGSSDIQYWSMGSYVQSLETKMTWNEYARNIYAFTFLTDTVVIILTIFGLSFSLIGCLYILLNFLKRKISPLVSLISVNVMFFVMISFFFEGQSRYNYPILFIFIISFVYIISVICKNLNLEDVIDK